MRQQDTVREDAAKMAEIVRGRLSEIVPAASMELFGSQCIETGDFYLNIRIRRSGCAMVRESIMGQPVKRAAEAEA